MMLQSLLQSSNEIVTPAVDPTEITVGIDIFAVVGRYFSGEGTGILGSIFGFLGLLWTGYTIFAYVISILLLTLLAYASVHKKMYADLQDQVIRDSEQLYHEQFRGAGKNSRLRDILVHVESDHPNDWKLAIIEADIILDDVLKERGYRGISLGERLKSISPQHLSSLNDAWEAHKIRNRIAHDGADFVLTKRTAQETITRYQRVFTELGVK